MRPLTIGSCFILSLLSHTPSHAGFDASISDREIPMRLSYLTVQIHTRTRYQSAGAAKTGSPETLFLLEEEMIKHRRIMAVVFASMVLLPSRFLFSQESSPQASTASQDQASTDKDIELLRKDVRSQKKQLIAANMNLTEKEAEQFWPVYDQYTDELVKINDKKYAAIKQYAQSYDTLTDAQAVDLTKQALDVDQSVVQLRMKYLPIFQKVVSGKKTAQFFQLDRRLVGLIDLQLASGIPLAEP
jgi:hypothetical protein